MTETAEIEVWRAEASSAAPELPALTAAQLQLRQMVLDSVTSTHSRRAYAKGLDLLFAFAASRPLTRALLMEYRTSMEDLAPSTVNVRLAAVRKMVTEAKQMSAVPGGSSELDGRSEHPAKGNSSWETGSRKSRQWNCWWCRTVRP